MKITLQPSLLRWARQRVGLDETALAEKLGAKEEQVKEWERNGVITYKRADKLAKVSYIPFGYLFLKEPPEDKLPITDFRTINSERKSAPSPELLDVLHDAMRKQNWYREYLIDLGQEPLSFVGSVAIKESPVEVAKKIREWFFFETSSDNEIVNAQKVFDKLIDQCEAQGILVLRSGIAEGNTHRALDVNEFRGFALTDVYAPLIFINTKDSPAAQLFTLVHELVHIGLNVSGVSNLEKTYASEQKIEQFCNQVTAEVFVPRAALIDCLNKGIEDIAQLRQRFRVSSLVILRRLKDIEKINEDTFRKEYQKEEENFAQKKANSTGDGNYYATRQVSVGKPFARAIISNALEGHTPYREAFNLLGIKKTATFKEFACRLNFDVNALPS